MTDAGNRLHRKRIGRSIAAGEDTAHRLQRAAIAERAQHGQAGIECALVAVDQRGVQRRPAVFRAQFVQRRQQREPAHIAAHGREVAFRQVAEQHVGRRRPADASGGFDRGFLALVVAGIKRLAHQRQRILAIARKTDRGGGAHFLQRLPQSRRQHRHGVVGLAAGGEQPVRRPAQVAVGQFQPQRAPRPRQGGRRIVVAKFGGGLEDRRQHRQRGAFPQACQQR